MWGGHGVGAGKPQSVRTAALSTRPGLPVGVLQSHRPQGVQIPPGGGVGGGEKQ